MSEKWKARFLFLISIFALLGAAFYNGYPLVTSDTGTYINSAFTAEVARDRPFGYSILIFISSLKFSLWITVFVQALVTYYLCWRVLRHTLPNHDHLKSKAFVLVVLLSLFSSLSWFTSMIMPDLFTALGVLAGYLYLTETQNRYRYIALGLFLYSMTTHTSHVLIFSLLGLALLIYSYLRRKEWKQYLVFSLICLSGWLILPGLHWVVDGEFKASKSTHVFLTGRFIETGTLQRYLRRTCSETELALCTYRDQLPKTAIDFIWNNDSPLYATDGWDDPNGEYRHLVKTILTTPKYLFQFLYSSAWSSMNQLILTHVGDGLNPHVENSNPYWKVQQYYRYELPPYLNSRQNQNRLHFAGTNVRYQWAVIISTLFIAWIVFYRRIKLSQKQKLLVLMVFAAIIFNAIVTATFGNVLGRLQSRVMWLIPFCGVLLWLDHRPFNKVFGGGK